MAFLEIVAALLTTNPQSPAWVERVKACLGDRFRPCLPVWCSRNVELDDNHRLIGERLWALLPGIRNRLREGFAATGRERAIYQSAAILAIYGAFARHLGVIVAENGVKVPFWGSSRSCTPSCSRSRASTRRRRTISLASSTRRTGAGTSRSR